MNQCRKAIGGETPEAHKEIMDKLAGLWSRRHRFNIIEGRGK